MSPLFLAVALAALPYLTIDTPHFSFECYPPAETLTRHLAEHAEETYAGLSRELGHHFLGRITVRVAANAEQFAAMQPGSPAEWAKATAYPTRRLIVMQVGGDLNPERTLTHELSHVMLLGALRGRPAPTWLAEGLAMHHAGEWDVGRWAALSQAATFGTLIPLAELTEDFPQDPERARLAYAESWSLVGFIRQEAGEEGLRRLARALAAGKRPERALWAATGLPPAELERRWVHQLEVRFSWVPILTGSGVLWGGLMALSIFVWRRKRRRTRAMLARWEAEEAGADDSPPEA